MKLIRWLFALGPPEYSCIFYNQRVEFGSYLYRDFERDARLNAQQSRRERDVWQVMLRHPGLVLEILTPVVLHGTVQSLCSNHLKIFAVEKNQILSFEWSFLGGDLTLSLEIDKIAGKLQCNESLKQDWIVYFRRRSVSTCYFSL